MSANSLTPDVSGVMEPKSSPPPPPAKPVAAPLPEPELEGDEITFNSSNPANRPSFFFAASALSPIPSTASEALSAPLTIAPVPTDTAFDMPKNVCINAFAALIICINLVIIRFR